MSFSLSPEEKRKNRIQSSEAFKSILHQKRRIHRLFEKKIPKVIAKSVRCKSKASIGSHLENLNHLQTQSSPFQEKIKPLYLNEDLSESIQKRMNKTSQKFVSWSKITNKASRIRAKAATPEIYYKALQTVFKDSTIKPSMSKLKTGKISRIVL
jgi:hypothetical protein